MTAAVFLLGLLACFVIEPAFAFSSLRAAATAGLQFQQHPGVRLPLDAPFLDDAGTRVRLGDVFRGTPVVLVLEYLRCRSLCGFVLQDAAQALAHVPLVPGRDYQVVALSIDPRDRPADARAARGKYVARFGPYAAAGWHFLTGEDRDIRAVAAAVGFPYRYDPEIDQYAHPAGVTIASPDGIISRYILGVGYRPLDLRLALTEASRGTIASPAADLLLLCYCYDPATGRYSATIGTVTRILCGATVLGLLAMIAVLARARRA